MSIDTQIRAVSRTSSHQPSRQATTDGQAMPLPCFQPTTTHPVTFSVIMPTVFWSGTFERCARRVLSLMADAPSHIEIVFVFDGDAPPAPAWLDQPGVTIVTTGVRSGPAVSRNLGARSARGEILFFVDADVELAPDAIECVQAAFDADHDLVGLFGTYDDEPASDGAASMFRNLLHHHTHVSNPGKAGTFWSGCGVIRTAAFLDVGGFDEKYAIPSVEDIELGMRITANGGRIVRAPKLLCKHLKRWTVASMVITDIMHRARPWTHLVMNSRKLPASLTLDWRARLSGLCSIVLAGCLAAAAFTPIALWIALSCGLALVQLNSDFYRLCLRKRGLGFAFSAAALHWLYFVYSSLTCAVAAAETLVVERCKSLMGRVQPPAANRATARAYKLSPARS